MGPACGSGRADPRCESDHRFYTDGERHLGSINRINCFTDLQEDEGRLAGCAINLPANPTALPVASPGPDRVLHPSRYSCRVREAYPSGNTGGNRMGAGFQMLMSGDPLAIILGLGSIAAIGFFIYFALRGDKPDEKK